jgi:hypothetical protein
MVGDRLDTDIDGAIGAGLDCLAVLSGVTSIVDLANLPPERRPTFVGRDLFALVTAHPDVALDATRATCGAAVVALDDGLVRLDEGDPASLEAARAAVTLAWSARDRTGRDVQLDGTLGP